MSRATATPTASGAPGSVTTPGGAPAGGPSVAGAQAAPVAAGSASRRRAALLARTALEGTPGRMRLLGFVAALAAAVFGIIGATSLWSAAERSTGPTSTRSRSCGSRASTPTSCAPTPTRRTRSSWAGRGQRPARRLRRGAGAGGERHHRRRTGAAGRQRRPRHPQHQGADVASTVEQARVYNRQGQPVGAQYLNQASAGLRTDVLPVVDALSTANSKRATTEFAASSTRPALFLAGAARPPRARRHHGVARPPHPPLPQHVDRPRRPARSCSPWVSARSPWVGSAARSRRCATRTTATPSPSRRRARRRTTPSPTRA